MVGVLGQSRRLESLDDRLLCSGEPRKNKVPQRFKSPLSPANAKKEYICEPFCA